MSRRCPRKSVDQTRPLRKLWAISAKPDPLQLLGLSGFSGFVIRSVTCVWLINISWIRLKCCRTEFFRKRSVFWSNVTLEYIDWWSHGFPWNCCFVLDWCYGIEMNWYENKIFLCVSVKIMFTLSEIESATQGWVIYLRCWQNIIFSRFGLAVSYIDMFDWFCNNIIMRSF